MKTLASAGAVLPSSDGVQGKQAAKRTAGKPQRFAAVVALAGLKVGRTPNKETVVKAAAAAVPRSEQGAPDVRKRENRSTPGTVQAVTGFGLVGQPVDPPLASRRRSVVKTNSAFRLPSNNVGRRIEVGGQRSAPRPKSPDRALHTGVVAPVGSNPRAQPTRPENPHSGATYTPPPKEARLVRDAHLEAMQGRGVAIPKKVEFRTEARAPNPAATSVRDGTAPKSHHNEGRDTNAAPIAQIKRRNTDAKEQGPVVGPPAERAHLVKDGGVPDSEGQTVAKDDGSSKARAAQPSVKPHVAVPLERAEQAGVNATYTYRAPVISARHESDRGVQRPPIEEQPRPRSQSNGGPRRQEARTEAAQPSVSGVPSAGPKAKGSVPREPPAPYTGGQSVATVPHPPAEAQTRGVAQVRSDGTNNPVRELGEQILDSLQASVTQGQRQVTIRLQPPELGTVLVRTTRRCSGGRQDRDAPADRAGPARGSSKPPGRRDCHPQTRRDKR